MRLSRGRAALLLALFVAALFVAGCGGSDDGGPITTAGPPVAKTQRPEVDGDRYTAQAEAICRRGRRETRALGRKLPGIIASSTSPQQGITNGLVRPGTEILSREAADLRSLSPVPSSRSLQVYLGLFDPILELAQQRLEASSADDPDRARALEQMIVSLGNEQSAAAREFGLRACTVSFTQALGGSR